MTLPTTEQVMSMYLYGQDTKPDLDALRKTVSETLSFASVSLARLLSKFSIRDS